MHGNTALACDAVNPAVTNDLGMGSHFPMMHYALQESKCLLHHGGSYLSVMDQIEVGKRLAAARKKAGFEKAKDAAVSLGVPVPTYIQHENGTRGFRAATAERYAKRFKTTPQWILYAQGDEAGPEPTEAEIEEMLRGAIEDVVTVQTKLSDFPRIVAPVLREQLERFRADRGVIDYQDAVSARDRASRSPAPTKRVGSAE